jgi:hypothetical protein
MRISTPSLIIVLALIAPIVAVAGGLPPWQFGMTKEQVKSFKQFGPYKAFSNGDLETYNGVLHGRKEDVQFYFQNNRLTRIAVHLWEGNDPKKGIPAWRRVYDVLQKDYGKVAQPDLSQKPGDKPLPPDVVAIAGAGHTYATGNTRLEPAKQPRDILVHARFMGMTIKPGPISLETSPMGNSFAVVIFFDPR